MDITPSPVSNNQTIKLPSGTLLSILNCQHDLLGLTNAFRAIGQFPCTHIPRSLLHQSEKVIVVDVDEDCTLLMICLLYTSRCV